MTKRQKEDWWVPRSKEIEGEKGERIWAKWGVTAKGYEVSFGDE